MICLPAGPARMPAASDACRLTSTGLSWTSGGWSSGRSRPAWVSAARYRSVQLSGSAASIWSDDEAVASVRMAVRSAPRTAVCWATYSSARQCGVAAAMMLKSNAVSPGWSVWAPAAVRWVGLHQEAQRRVGPVGEIEA